MSKTKIEWAEKVWNPVTGCSKISEGCRNCYAERMAKRLAGRCGYPTGDPFKMTLHHDHIGDPVHWRNPSRIFLGSMTDLFHDDVPFYWLDKIFDIATRADRHTFLVLTKRPERMKAYFSRPDIIWPFKNVWLGVTAENQDQADKRIPILLQTPAAVRFVSVEPMLGSVDIRRYFRGCPPGCMKDALCPLECGHKRKIGLDWVICGGESGPGARPMHPDWARSLRYQCHAAGVPFLFKQHGEWLHIANSPTISSEDCKKYRTSQLAFFVESNLRATFAKVGKKKAGRLLDGQLWDQYPEIHP